MMVLEFGLFFFVLLGSKVVLGAVVVYMLLPRDGGCEVCDAATLPIEHPRGTHRLLRLLRLQRRWCMECRRESLSRSRAPSRAHHARPPVPVAEHRLR